MTDLDQQVYPYTISENWALKPVDQFEHGFYTRDDSGWLPTKVPGHWQEHPELADYAGKVVYATHFRRPNAPRRKSDRYWLRINGAFYWSQPYLNGIDLGRHEGYFAPYEIDVSDLLEEENRLFIELECNNEYKRSDKRMLTGVFSHWDSMDRTMNPGGLWRPVELQRSGPIRIKSVRCHTETISDSFAQLRFWAEFDSLIDSHVTLRWTFTPLTFDGQPQVHEQRRMLRPGRHELNGFLKLRDPKLWWSHDLGEPHLYRMRLEVLIDEQHSDHYESNFGVRRFELRNWIPYLNGVRFLIKGNNYGPGDARIAHLSSARCARDIELAREAHMNLLRVHAHVSNPSFYEEADKAGMLVWQDMPLQWLYQRSILEEAKRQTREMVRMLFNHPSIVIWCMHNEAVYTVDTADERLITRLRTYNSALFLNWSRDVLDKQMQKVAQSEDPLRPVIRSSGEITIPGYRAGNDVHFYFGWYRSYGTLNEGELIFKHFLSNTHFVTEFGAQSFPNLESSLKFIDPDLRKLDEEHLAIHHNFQPDVMAHWINWRSAGSLEEIINLSQKYQSMINRYYIDRLRVNKYRPTGGIVPFQFQDSHPAIQWSVVDYWRVPKQSYYALKIAFSPQYVCAIFAPRTYKVGEQIEFKIYAMNDAQHAVHNLICEAWLRQADGGELAYIEHTLTMGADCLAFEIDRLRFTPPQPGLYTLTLALSGTQNSDFEHTYEISVV